MAKRSAIGLMSILILISLLAACTGSGGDLPVPTVASLDTLPTADFLTRNAPPIGFSTISVDPIDAYLSNHQGWAYTIIGTFSGTFDDSGEPATGEFTVQVEGNELGQTRYVILEASGSALLSNDALLRLEGVRLSNDYYVVDINGRCVQDETSGKAIADQGANQFIGGVAEAIPTGHQREIEGIQAWQYTFAPQAVRLPALHLDENSTYSIGADLWFAPSVNAVLIYEVNVAVTRAYILWADPETSSTVSGTLYIRYDLSLPALGTLPNISIPNGC